MPGTVANLIQGPALVYVGDTTTTEPANAIATLAAGWVDVGFTDGGVKLTVGQSYDNLEVDQIALPVGARLGKQKLSIATAFAEATLPNLRISMNVPTAAGSFYEIDSTVANVEPTYRSILIEGRGPTNLPRRIILRRALSTEDVEYAYKKGDKVIVPVTFSGFYVSSTVKAIKIDDAQS